MPFVLPLLMSFLLYSYSLVSLAADSSSTAYIPSVKAPLASQSLLLDITTIGQVKLVAVGEHGHIIMSSDGVNWQQSSVPVQTTLTNVFFYNELLGWAVGHDATILHSQDGGLTWQVQQYKPTLEKPLLNVVFKTPLEGLAIGAYGLLFRTLDGGKTWQKEFHSEFLLPDDAEYLAELKQEDEEAYLDEASSILPHFNRLVLDGRTLYMVGEIGLIAKSYDFGKTWQLLDEIYQGSFFDITRTLKGNLLVVGLRGHVFRSSKNGTPWQQRQTNTTALINDIVLTSDNRIFLLANNGTLLESNDDGQSYSLRNQKDGKSLIAGVWFNNQLIVVSDVGVKIISL
ncbi:WD40/YVTN/BNR-like repeat-containing protein [Candidatus Colwellia aromaticivorans]|uniref:WD40/YVTN/BNR-like repeat-containing protein n=1 Tax=Candidatus Colwellia aromaticivorans TaxID=2267621 RepID=UPI000DF3B69A|nr:YCF48-related protein [Candidatus Colwellia aromaticivorans]